MGSTRFRHVASSASAACVSLLAAPPSNGRYPQPTPCSGALRKGRGAHLLVVLVLAREAPKARGQPRVTSSGANSCMSGKAVAPAYLPRGAACVPTCMCPGGDRAPRCPWRLALGLRSPLYIFRSARPSPDIIRPRNVGQTPPHHLCRVRHLGRGNALPMMKQHLTRTTQVASVTRCIPVANLPPVAHHKSPNRGAGRQVSTRVAPADMPQ